MALLTGQGSLGGLALLPPITGPAPFALDSIQIGPTANQITLNYNKLLNPAITPKFDAFGVGERYVSDVQVAGSTVVVSTDIPYTPSDSFVFQYNPGADPITSADAEVAPAITNSTTTNAIDTAVQATLISPTSGNLATSMVEPIVIDYQHTDVGIDESTIVPASLLVTDGGNDATVTIDRYEMLANGRVRVWYEADIPTTGTYSIQTGASPVANNNNVALTSTTFRSGITVVDGPTVELSPTQDPTSEVNGSNTSILIRFSHPSGINAGSADPSKLILIDNFGQPVTLTATGGGTPTVVNATTTDITFTYNVPTSGFHRIYLEEGAIAATDGTQSTYRKVAENYNIVTDDIINFPRSGFNPVSDRIDLNQYKLDESLYTRGIASAELANSPVGIAGNALRIRSKHTNNNFARTLFEMASHSVGTAYDPQSFESDRITGRCTYVARMMITQLPASGRFEIFRLEVTSNGNPSLWINSAGQLSLYEGTTQDTGLVSTTIPLNTWFELCFEMNTNDRSLRVLYRTDFKAAFTVLRNAPSFLSGTSSAMRFWRCGVISGSGYDGSDIEVWLNHLRTGTFVANIERDDSFYYLTGSGCRDVDTANASITLAYPDGLFANAVKARVSYSTDQTFATGVTTTNYQYLSKSIYHILSWALSGLAGVHYYRFEIADKSDAIIYTSDTYRLKTLPTNPAETFTFLTGGCVNQRVDVRPENGLFFARVQAATDPDWIGYEFLGDWGYADGIADTLQFERVIRQVFASQEMVNLSRYGMLFAFTDDHIFINNGDGRIAPPDGPFFNSDPNTWPDGTDTYDPGVTLGDLWQNGYGVFHQWFGMRALIKPQRNYEHYSSRDFGQTRFVRIDCRTGRRPDQNLYMSTTQFNWLKSEITSFGSNASLTVLHVFSNDAISDYYAKDSEGWSRTAQAQYRELSQHIFDDVPTTNRVIFHSSDDHIGWMHVTNIWKDGAEIQATNPFVGEMKSCGIAVRNHKDRNVNATYRAFGYDLSGFVNSGLIKTSGVYYRQTSTEITLDAWEHNAQVENDRSLTTF